MEAIYKRRSIRKFNGDRINKNILLSFIKAGMNAPSARNQQLWHFVLIQERTILNKIPNVHPYSSMLKEAAAAILVCADSDLELTPGYQEQDCAAATENILLEITDQGFGAVWLGVHPRLERVEGLRSILHVPDTVLPISLIAVGVPAEEKSAKDIFLEERIHFDTW